MKAHRLLFFVLLLGSLAPSALAQNQPQLYGYFSTRLEKVFSEPGVDGSTIVHETAPAEWSAPYLNVMLQHKLDDRFRVFVNLNGSGDGGVNVQNFWGDYTFTPAFQVRLGRIYRKFGLYNEVLDAVPTYYGIEAPELFDGDHLIVSRTTTAMLHGSLDAGPGVFSYSLTTDNGEGGPKGGTLPVGWDVTYQKGFAYRVGLSGYTSGGATTPDRGVGEGSPNSGVLPWMAEDNFWVVGGYGETNVGNLTLQAAYWHANHDAERNADDVVTVVNQASVNPAQRARFLLDPNGPVNVANVDVNGAYNIDTWYVRAGYSFIGTLGEVAPYVQWDWYSNPETIAAKTYGGDNEAGAADDGVFAKGTLGVVYRPTPMVAIKLDASTHRYTLLGESVQYPELRFDVSYIFGQ